MRGARPAVQSKQWRRPGPKLAGYSVPGAVAAKVGIALGNTRLHAGLQYGLALLAQLVEHLHGKSARLGNTGESRGQLSQIRLKEGAGFPRLSSVVLAKN